MCGRDDRPDESRSGVGPSADSASQQAAADIETLATVIGRASPMGDLSRFVIDDLTAEEEDAFFAILEQA